MARLHGPGDIRVGDEAVPSAGAGESLVRVAAVGLCGSDLHWYDEGGIGDAQLTRPLVIGHEFAGVVVGGPFDGQLVAVDPAVPCGGCASCRRGYYNLCPAVDFAGHGTSDGALREYLAWPTAHLHPLPPGLSAADGAMLEPLGVAVHAVDLGHVHLGATVAVVGCGPIGLMLVQLARRAGATRVYAVDPLPHRQAAAEAFGARPLPSDAELGPIGLADVVFEVGGTDDALHTCLLAARPGARVVLVGIPSTDRTSFTAAMARRKGLSLVLVRRMNEVYPRAIALVAAGDVDVRSVVTDRFPLSRASEALAAAARRGGLKVIVEPDAT
ncbi:NAD(P)-dependent alcohol dehydrogenase [Luedemannella flava]|uniref:NAD(P)-dependent alcohol dehydrogenase n=1 Tax=Luedemannella flava TaxID=349316 RepID=A0ABP4YMG8_9ACTN